MRQFKIMLRMLLGFIPGILMIVLWLIEELGDIISTLAYKFGDFIKEISTNIITTIIPIKEEE